MNGDLAFAAAVAVLVEDEQLFVDVEDICDIMAPGIAKSVDEQSVNIDSLIILVFAVFLEKFD